MGEEELKSKIGQLLYNTYLVERLKSEIKENLHSRNQLSLRMDLGSDSGGNDIVLDVFLNRFSPELSNIKNSKGIPEPDRLATIENDSDTEQLEK